MSAEPAIADPANDQAITPMLSGRPAPVFAVYGFASLIVIVAIDANDVSCAPRIEILPVDCRRR